MLATRFAVCRSSHDYKVISMVVPPYAIDDSLKVYLRCSVLATELNGYVSVDAGC